MTDQTIPADKLREVIDHMVANLETDASDDEERGFHRATALWRDALDGLLPAPPLHTLVDMTPEEREACQWMQADHRTHGRIIITCVMHGSGVGFIDRSGDTFYEAEGGMGTVTPLPDLPRMEWPSGEPEEPTEPANATPDQQVNRQGILNSSEPQVGEAWRAIWDYYGRTVTAIKRTDGHWWAIDGDEEPHVVARTGITPVTRLVPETPRKTLVTKEDFRGKPVATVVRELPHDACAAIEKIEPGYWVDTQGFNYSDEELAGTAREVLWEPEA